jgi:hypothetical protein
LLSKRDIQVAPVCRDSEFEQSENEAGAPPARGARRTFKQGAPVSRDSGLSRLERHARGRSRARHSNKAGSRLPLDEERWRQPERRVERETGFDAPSTNHRVHFAYRLRTGLEHAS